MVTQIITTPYTGHGYLTPVDGFTVECWFNHTALPTYPEALINQQTQNKAVNTNASPAQNGRQLLIWLDTTTGFLRVEIRNTAGTLLFNFADTASDYTTDSAWHFLALRVAADKKTVTLWLDSEVKSTAVMATAIDWVPGVMSIGAAYAPHLGNFGNFYYNGGLSYVAIWDKALLDARVADHYTAGTGGTVFYGDDEVERLERLYNYVEVPTNARVYDEPVTTLQGVQISGQVGLETILNTAYNASGLVFADGQAVMVYHNRAHRYNAPVVVTLSEDSGSAPDVGMEFSTDDTKVYNDVRASRPFGGSARIRNRASEDEYGRRVYDLKLAITNDEEMRNAGTWLAERYGEDKVRVSGVSLSAESSDLIQYVAETISIGDRIAFDDMPGNAPDTYMEYVVEAISVEANFRAETWSVGLELSPAELWDVLQVGVSTLGDGSRIAY